MSWGRVLELIHLPSADRFTFRTLEEEMAKVRASGHEVSHLECGSEALREVVEDEGFLALVQADADPKPVFQHLHLLAQLVIVRPGRFVTIVPMERDEPRCRHCGAGLLSRRDAGLAHMTVSAEMGPISEHAECAKLAGLRGW